MRRPDERSHRTESGAVAVMVALSMVMLTIAAALVVDFGIVRVDRQVSRAAADSAAAAGAQVMDAEGKDVIRPFRGACAALDFLKTNSRFASFSTSDWRTGAGTSVSDPCSNPASATYQTPCVAGTSSSWAWFHGTATNIEVDIKAGYQLTDGAWPEESLITGDDTAKGGCDQIAVFIRQTRQPGLGSLASTADLSTRIRSVARINPPGPPEEPIALLLLEPHNCAVLDNNGVNTKIVVKGTGDSPGRIHADSLGDGAVLGLSGNNCGSGSQILNGNITDGIVAQKTLPAATQQRPGIISMFALSGAAAAQSAKAYDAPPMVRAENAPGELPTPGSQITRRPIDEQYRLGVQDAINDAKLAWSQSPTAVDKVVSNCNTAPSAAVQSHTGTLYINCSWNNYGANLTFDATTVIISDGIQLSGNLSFPNATRVYVRGSSSPLKGLEIGSNKFRMNYATQPVADKCADGHGFPSARLVLGYGGISATNNSLLQLCNTAVILMGDGPAGTGCVPTTDGTPPVDATAPTMICDDAVLNTQGGDMEWTAPNEVGANPTAAQRRALEDLALWTEAASNSHGVGGGANMHLAGVFMLPNADYFSITGGGVQQVENSQYIARRLRVTGSGTLTMAPRAEDTVPIPPPREISLVR